VLGFFKFILLLQ